MARKQGIDRHKVLEELVKKADTPEQVHLLMEMNIDRTAGLIQEIYELRGELSGYKKMFKDITEELIYYRNQGKETE